MTNSDMVLKNSDVSSNLNDKLHHLSTSKQDEMTQLFFRAVSCNVPGKTECVFHDADVGDVIPTK